MSSNDKSKKGGESSDIWELPEADDTAETFELADDDVIEEIDPAEPASEDVGSFSDVFASFAESNPPAPAAPGEPESFDMADFDAPADPAADAAGDAFEAFDASDEDVAAPAQAPGMFDDFAPEAAEVEDAPAFDAMEPGEATSPPNPESLFGEEVEAAEAMELPEAAAVPSTPSRAMTFKTAETGGRKGLWVGLGAVVVVAGAAGAFFLFGMPGSEPIEPAPVAAQLQPAPAPATGAAEAAGATAAAEPATAEVAADAAAAEPVAEPAATQPEPQVETAPPPAPVPAPAPKPVAQKAAPASEPAPSGPASRVLAVETTADGVVIRGDGAFERVKYFTMGKPNRIIIDAYGVKRAYSGLNFSGSGAVAKVRTGEHKGKIRFVLDLKKAKGAAPAYEVDREGDRIVVRVR